jgi:hypothetical protein
VTHRTFRNYQTVQLSTIFVMVADEKLPRGVGRVPNWWLEEVPHDVLMIDEQVRQAEIISEQFEQAVAEESLDLNALKEFADAIERHAQEQAEGDDEETDKKLRKYLFSAEWKVKNLNSQEDVKKIRRILKHAEGVDINLLRQKVFAILQCPEQGEAYTQEMKDEGLEAVLKAMRKKLRPTNQPYNPAVNPNYLGRLKSTDLGATIRSGGEINRRNSPGYWRPNGEDLVLPSQLKQRKSAIDHVLDDADKDKDDHEPTHVDADVVKSQEEEVEEEEKEEEEEVETEETEKPETTNDTHPHDENAEEPQNDEDDDPDDLRIAEKELNPKEQKEELKEVKVEEKPEAPLIHSGKKVEQKQKDEKVAEPEVPTEKAGCQCIIL